MPDKPNMAARSTLRRQRRTAKLKSRPVEFWTKSLSQSGQFPVLPGSVSCWGVQWAQKSVSTGPRLGRIPPRRPKPTPLLPSPLFVSLSSLPVPPAVSAFRGGGGSHTGAATTRRPSPPIACRSEPYLRYRVLVHGPAAAAVAPWR